MSMAVVAVMMLSVRLANVFFWLEIQISGVGKNSFAKIHIKAWKIEHKLDVCLATRSCCLHPHESRNPFNNRT